VWDARQEDVGGGGSVEGVSDRALTEKKKVFQRFSPIRISMKAGSKTITITPNTFIFKGEHNGNDRR
jgi:hypothetical protein